MRLSIVAVLAALSGYSAAKWSTESRVELAIRNFDSSTFDLGFTALVLLLRAARIAAPPTLLKHSTS